MILIASIVSLHKLSVHYEGKSRSILGEKNLLTFDFYCEQLHLFSDEAWHQGRAALSEPAKHDPVG